MAESSNTIRLMKAAKEFNIGKDTLVEFLKKKGYEVQNNPNAILSDVMYDSLVSEYAADKAAKKKSESVILSTKKEEVAPKPIEKLSLKKDDAVKVVVKDVIDLEPKKPIAKKETVKKEEKKIEEPVVEEEKKEKKKQEKVVENIKIDAPELKGPKVVGSVDLTKKKKTAVTKPEEVKPEEVKPEEVKSEPAEEQVNEIENIKVDKLEGPKVIGHITLPVSQSPSSIRDKNRKRKRIPVDRKGATEAPKDPNAPPAPRTPYARPLSERNGWNNRNGQGGGGNRRPNTPLTPEEKIIDQNQIQDKIKQTLAKLGSNTKGKSSKAKYRRTKREEMAEKRTAREDGVEQKLQLTEFISVSELASLMDVNFTEVIGKCMNLGIMVSINQRLDAEVIELVASEFGFEVEFINLEQEAEQEIEIVDAEEDLRPRAPIVTIMGHVDHGKTSLLDYIRNTTVVAGEAGGITQHIGAYEVTLPNGKEITFLDTPGHEAFTAMRARGAKLTDIAVIVIAADDAIMPQTKEAISHAQAAGVPMIFAINKIDKDGAQPDKIREQLSGMNILVEEWGGKFQSQELSAKSGQGVSELLEKILLEAELLELKANPNRFSTGTIVEATLDKGRGFVSTLLVQSGTLKVGDMIVAGSIYGRVKAMSDERGKRKDSAGPSTPIQILGLNGAAQSGEKFKVYEDENEAREIATHRAQIMREQGMRTRKHITLDEIGRRLALGNFKQLNLIIKGDVDGSVEALSDSLQKLSTDEVAISVVHKAVGQITESDVLLATASDAIIVGFQVRPSAQASKLADNENIEIRTYSIIYDAIDEIKSAMEGLLEPKIEKKTVCNIEVRNVFKITGVEGPVAGCFVLDGKIKRENKINVIRDGIVIFTGELSSLKRFKDDVKEVISGIECGLGIKKFNDIQPGDIIEGYEEFEVKRTL